MASEAMPVKQPMPAVLWALLFGNFVIGTGVMAVPGTLNELSTSLQVPIATAGQLISVGALLICLGAPLFASLVAGWDRRRLLALTMLWYAVLHLVCAAMPTFGSLFFVRVLAMVSPAVFTPQAAACVGLLVAADQRGRAITMVFLGWSVASVLGMPMAAWMGGTLGWRSTFIAIGVLGLISTVWVWRAMPNGIKPPALTWHDWTRVLGSKALMLCVAVTAAYSAGQFVLFAYFAPYFKATLALSPTQLSLLFAWFGLFGFIGNLWMSNNIDRMGAPKAVFLAVMGMAFSMLLWPLGSSLIATACIMVPWALGCFASNSAQQSRLVGLAPTLASGSIALNTSAMYVGQAIGAASGGWMISHERMGQLHWVGFAGLVLSLAISTRAARAALALK